MKKSQFPLALIITLSLGLILSHSKVAKAYWYLDEYGFLRNLLVLGEDDDRSGSSGSGSGSNNEVDDSRDEADSRDDEDVDDVDDDADDDSSGREETRVEEKNDEYKYESETRTGDSREKIRIESKDGKLLLRRELKSTSDSSKEKSEIEIDLSDQGVFEVKDRVESRSTRIATGSGDEKVIIRARSAAKTSFPLSIDTATNELIVTTPAGTRVVSVLPDAAVSRLLELNILDSVTSASDTLGEEGEELDEIDDVVELEEEDGTLVYQVAGEKEEKILGLFATKIKKTVTLSAETGEVLRTRMGFFTRILDLVSF